MAILDDGTIAVAFDPDWDLRRQRTSLAEESVSIGGKMATFLWGDYRSYSLPVTYIPSSDAMQINKWWRNGDELNADIQLEYFTLGDSYLGLLDQSYNPLYGDIKFRIVNTQQPFSQFIRPYTDEYAGTLEIEAI